MAADLAVQQALFLKPVELSEVLVETRQLLALGEAESVDIDKCTVVGQLNPFAEKICGSIKFRAAQSQELALPRQRWRGSYREYFASFGNGHPDGIWRGMFITQPPCIRVHVEIYALHFEPSDLEAEITYVQEVNQGFSLERSGGVKLGDLYDYVSTYYDHWDPHSVRTTVRKYVTEDINLPDRTSCIVSNGEIHPPEQLPGLPDVDCDAFGGNFDYSSTRGWWASIDGQAFRREEYFEKHGIFDDGTTASERYSCVSSIYDSEQEGDGELDDGDGHGNHGHGGEVDDDDDDDYSRHIPLQRPRVNVYMPLRKHTVGQDSSEEGVGGNYELR